MNPPLAESKRAPWYGDWQNGRHVRMFDTRSRMSDRALVRHYGRFSDVLLFDEAVRELQAETALEVGCATGEFYRYLRQKHPALRYTGLDLSEAAIARARQKYPEASIAASRPERSVQENLEALKLPPRHALVYSKDVVHHQTQPFAFIEELLHVASDALILRTRTRDAGATVLDPELSCQYTYDGWVPYIVLNADELVRFFQQRSPGCELRLLKERGVLGGVKRRFLPKECYLPETGTAETTVGIFLKTKTPGRVEIRDVPPDGAAVA